MSLNRFAVRRDSNELQIVKDLRKCGYFVRQQDFPDLLIRCPDGRIKLLEIDGITKNRKRSAKQLEFLAEWEIPRVRTTEEALRCLTS